MDLLSYLNQPDENDNGYQWYNSRTAVVFDPSNTYELVLPDDVTYKLRIDQEMDTESTYPNKDLNPGPSWKQSMSTVYLHFGRKKQLNRICFSNVRST